MKYFWLAASAIYAGVTVNRILAHSWGWAIIDGLFSIFFLYRYTRRARGIIP